MLGVWPHFKPKHFNVEAGRWRRIEGWSFSARKSIFLIFTSWYITCRASQVAQWQRTHLPMQETQEMWVRSLGQKRQPTPVFLPGKSNGQRSLVGYSPWGCRVGPNWVTEHTHVKEAGLWAPPRGITVETTDCILHWGRKSAESQRSCAVLSLPYNLYFMFTWRV